jgi:uncharacterized membrane protein YkgB
MSFVGLLVGYFVLIATFAPLFLLPLIERDLYGRGCILAIYMSFCGISFMALFPDALIAHYAYSFFAFLIGLLIFLFAGACLLVGNFSRRREHVQHPATQTESIH